MMPPRTLPVWTVDREVDQSIRHMNQLMSGGSFVANLTLRLIPDLDVSGVTFASEVTDPDAAPYIPSVEEGVRAFVSRRGEDGFPVGYLRVTLTKITIHPIDVQQFRFRQAADMAMTEAFKSHGMRL